MTTKSNSRPQATVAETDQGAIGAASAWLAFYAIAALVVIAGNFQKAAELVVAGCSTCN